MQQYLFLPLFDTEKKECNDLLISHSHRANINSCHMQTHGQQMFQTVFSQWHFFKKFMGNVCIIFIRFWRLSEQRYFRWTIKFIRHCKKGHIQERKRERNNTKGNTPFTVTCMEIKERKMFCFQAAGYKASRCVLTCQINLYCRTVCAWTDNYKTRVARSSKQSNSGTAQNSIHTWTTTG